MHVKYHYLLPQVVLNLWINAELYTNSSFMYAVNYAYSELQWKTPHIKWHYYIMDSFLESQVEYFDVGGQYNR